MLNVIVLCVIAPSFPGLEDVDFEKKMKFKIVHFFQPRGRKTLIRECLLKGKAQYT